MGPGVCIRVGVPVRVHVCVQAREGQRSASSAGPQAQRSEPVSALPQCDAGACRCMPPCLAFSVASEGI